MFSRLFGRKKEKNPGETRREGEPTVYNIPNEDDRMNQAIAKAGYTLHYFENCLSNPKSHQQYFSIKVRFEDQRKVEHIWLQDPHFDDEGNLYGTIGNEPVDIKTIKLGQQVGVERKLISDWMIIENGRLIGGYTIRAIRDGIPANELADFDNNLGMFIDEGEDHFPVNYETPEGAILTLEKAYDDQDLEAALASKDFRQEAIEMLKSKEKLTDNEEILKLTSEVLRGSFIKHMKENGMPTFKNVKRAFPTREFLSDTHCIVTEVCFYPDGTKSTQKLATYRGNDGWRVMNVVD